ncbi:uncharacterized protein PHALS_08972 [Plasmopara halstedii]|uniref:Uncharacterized protein n=1 Tax=Plasmopara halstedii TaxID=4781 RepID=A0A0P1AD83_PLAHL|nr:uncharacterized protein PHALS_08972 [Plasmopara halstedii]CEG38927.1 hypothetical protein PHALS_08972 [Plasmopara halstedii]|eukprot:XP_024575296.1 hypothetical protein PHALS_08972 [Plasmopara halstedii]
MPILQARRESTDDVENVTEVFGQLRLITLSSDFFRRCVGRDERTSDEIPSAAIKWKDASI